MREFIVLAALMMPAAPANDAAFCENSPFVPFSELVRGAKEFEGRRVRTHGILRTDGKEYTSITPDNKASPGALLEGDATSDAYARKHNLRSESRADLLADFLSKLRATRGESARLDISQLANYRQERLLCGRISRYYRGYKFAIDDSILEKSYLLPDGRKK